MEQSNRTAIQSRQQFINRLKELIADDPSLAEGNSDYELIYVIDDIKVYGAFDCGSRGIDHNILLFEGVEWSDVLNWGTALIVPETECYIAKEPVQLFEALGYERQPLDSNHIAGY